MFYTKKERQQDREGMERYIHNKTEIIRSNLQNNIQAQLDGYATEDQIDDVKVEFIENLDSQFKIILGVAMAAKITPKKLASMFKKDLVEVSEYIESFAEEITAQAERELGPKKKSNKKSK